MQKCNKNKKATGDTRERSRSRRRCKEANVANTFDTTTPKLFHILFRNHIDTDIAFTKLSILPSFYDYWHNEPIRIINNEKFQKKKNEIIQSFIGSIERYNAEQLLQIDQCQQHRLQRTWLNNTHRYRYLNQNQNQ